VQEYYTYGVVSEHMAKQGLKEGQSDGLHDDPVITLNMLMADPKSVRYDERIKAGKAVINGVDISDRTKAMAWGKQIVDFRAEYTAEAIKKAIANKGTLPAPPRTRPQGQ
jgi:creatinine amidohydrolase